MHYRSYKESNKSSPMPIVHYSQTPALHRLLLPTPPSSSLSQTGDSTTTTCPVPSIQLSHRRQLSAETALSGRSRGGETGLSNGPTTISSLSPASVSRSSTKIDPTHVEYVEAEVDFLRIGKGGTGGNGSMDFGLAWSTAAIPLSVVGLVLISDMVC